MHIDFLDLFISIIGLVPEIIILVASIQCVRKAPGVDALLMVVGSALTTVLSLGWLIPSVLPDSGLFFYYAGHGLQVRGKNYLVPIDAQISNESSIRVESVDVDGVLDQLATSELICRHSRCLSQ